MSDVVLKLHRAHGHRSFIGPEFDAGPDGIDPQALSYPEILANEKLAGLGREVYAQLREQFQPSAPDAPPDLDAEEEEYRRRLEGWAEVLEIMLEETLTELDRLERRRFVPPEERG